jgi:hypothetical protein
MSIRVTVNSVPKNRVSINSKKQETVRTVGIIPSQASEFLSSLRDVDASDPDNNETLVYDAATGKYVVKELPILNGGTF